ncbi:methylenetetrahydrofolate reductase [Streptomyces laurentii]|uniref:Methylenetetrahydrofolate reductase n=1 Tax=Streptomyces laurentii TaxID=39478 RepID=A0A169P5U3_STRLU|nr:methylenetetrahydrofolate reductase [Streptomyces laurentii]
MLDRGEDGVGQRRGPLDLAVVHVRVARVQKPLSGIVADGDARVPRGVARQGHQQQFAGEPSRTCQPREAEPRRALVRDGGRQQRAVRPVRRHEAVEAVPVVRVPGIRDGLVLGGVHMDPRVRKVRQPSGVVAV